MKDKTIYSKRAWLNPISEGDTGAIQAHVTMSAFRNSKMWIDSYVSIWDCGKKITLDFSSDAKRQTKARLKKINIMLEVLEGVKEGLTEASEELK